MRRRLDLALLATLQFCVARTARFNIHDDLVAFPQFEVVFSNEFIPEKDAADVLESDTRHPTYSADFSQSTAGDTCEANGAETDGPADAPAYSYEVMSMPPHRYLCSIPVIRPPPPENETANQLAKAEEARELSRAAARGWELLNQLEDSCLYFMSGWWSYSFCNNREIVQYHAMAAVPNGQPPRRDPHTAEYVLGRVPTIPVTAERQARQDSREALPLPAELQVKGDQRYLVQKLEGGTLCDLTGRERTIEVQYHCVPGLAKDRIGWIKEVTICAYVMAVNTPRLCSDVAFLPPEETSANPISCQLIVDDHGPRPPLLDRSMPAKEDDPGATEHDKTSKDKEPGNGSDVTVGGVVIGAREVLSGADEDGKPPVKLAPPRRFSHGEDRLVEILAQAASKEGGKIKTLSGEELEKLGIKPEVIREMKEKMEKIAGEAGWKLEVVELDGGAMRELRGYVDEEEAKGKTSGETEDQGEGKEDGSEEKFFKEL